MTLKIAGAVIIAIFFAYCIFRSNKSISFAVTSVLCVMIAISCLDNLIPLLKGIKDISSKTDCEYMSLMLKSLGIGIVSSAASSLCKRVGENSLSGIVEFFGKTEMIILCLPLLRSLLSLCGVEL